MDASMEASSLKPECEPTDAGGVAGTGGGDLHMEAMKGNGEATQGGWLPGWLPGQQSGWDAGSDMHATRLAQHELELIEQRAEALEHHTLAPAPGKKPTRSPLQELVRNLWVFGIMAGVVAIIVAAKDRILIPEPLAGVHATNGVVPYMLPLPNDSVDYLYVNLLIGPYYPPERVGSSSDGSSGEEGGSGGQRRRLAAWVGQTVAAAQQQGEWHVSGSSAGSSSCDSWVCGGSASGSEGSSRGSGGGDSSSKRRSNGEGVRGSRDSWQSPGAGLSTAWEAAELAQRVQELLSKPKLVLAQPQSWHGRGAADSTGSLSRRQLLSDQASQGTAPPELRVTLMQRLNSSALQPVSSPQYCPTRDGAAATCAMAFRGDDLTDAYAEGQPLYLGFESTQVTQLVFKVDVSELGGLGPAKNYIALAILVVVLLVIATERVHRMWCAMAGAGAMMGILLWMGTPPSLSTVVSWLDDSTLGLLWGMMIIVSRLADTGIFELFSAATVRASGGRMWLLSTMLMLVTAFVSAWLDNATALLLMGPITISMMRQCNTDPKPLLIAQALFSNIGGAATLVGDPPSLIIGTALSRWISFLDFIVYMGPGVLMAAAACLPLLLYLGRRSLLGTVNNYDAVLREVAGYRITDWSLMAKCGYVTVLVLVGFLLHPVHHVDPAWFAVLGAVVLCMCDQPREVDKVVRSVEWDMLLFFAALFVMVAAAAEVGVIAMIGGWLESAISSTPEGSRTIVAIQILLWLSALVSAFLDNIPWTILMVPVIEYLAFAGLGLELPVLAWALNFGACFGGNGTVIGASANLVTATLAERAGEKISFGSWMRWGMPVVLVSVTMADVWLILRFCF